MQWPKSTAAYNALVHTVVLELEGPIEPMGAPKGSLAGCPCATQRCQPCPKIVQENGYTMTMRVSIVVYT